MLNKRILIIDDEPSVLASYQEILTIEQEIEEGPFEDFSELEAVSEDEDENFDACELTLVKQGVEGVEAVRKGVSEKRPFAVAFVDMRIPPGIDGLETARRMRELDDRIYIVIVTAYADRSVDELQDALHHDIILVRKPFASEEIYQQARNFCIRWQRDHDLVEARKAEHAARLEIVETQREIIMSLGEMIELRSLESGEHVKRVSEYSYRLAKYRGLCEEEAQMIRMASPMHDVGKIGIPDAILHKPGSLTRDEFSLMKTHTTLGYQMLSKSPRPLLREAAVIAHEHHERYDGAGYPNRKQGEEIPLNARIVALVDVFDALSSDRCYRKAWEKQRVLELIRRERGGAFDPRLVDLFLDHLEEFYEIFRRFNGP